MLSMDSNGNERLDETKINFGIESAIELRLINKWIRFRSFWGPRALDWCSIQSGDKLWGEVANDRAVTFDIWSEIAFEIRVAVAGGAKSIESNDQLVLINQNEMPMKSNGADAVAGAISNEMWACDWATLIFMGLRWRSHLIVRPVARTCFLGASERHRSRPHRDKICDH